TGLVAMLFFRGNFEAARVWLSSPHYIPHMLSRSRFNRRLHRLNQLFLTLFELFGHTWKELNTASVYIIDSFPVSVCDNYRIPRAKLYQNEAYRGYIASKKRYFYGLKIHLMVTKDGQPVEFFLTHGGCGDVDALKYYTFDVPGESLIYADKAYNDYEIEDLLKEVDHIHLLPIRKKNSKRAYPQCVSFVQHYYRKRIETAGSLIEQRLPKSIHAVTSQGFELKVALFVVAYSLNCYIDL